MGIVIDAAFVLAITAFLKEQFQLKGYVVLVVAFLVSLAFAFAPFLAAQFPAVGQYIQVFFDTVLVFLVAAGSFDAVRAFQRKPAK